MVRWNDPLHIAWNVVATLIWLAGIASIVRSPVETFKQGWRSKALWLLLTALLGVYVGGLLIPLGPVVAIVVLRRDRVPVSNPPA
jgi:hypothetical protein